LKSSIQERDVGCGARALWFPMNLYQHGNRNLTTQSASEI
jgi:hypothetical protein